jgi:predicted restriction endonuclease
MIKEVHSDTCQICRCRLELTTGSYYSEGHHLKPLGEPHNGPDVAGNILCVCPNCHAKLDFGAIRIDVADLHKAPGHPIRPEFIDYHNDLCA